MVLIVQAEERAKGNAKLEKYKAKLKAKDDEMKKKD